MTLDHDGADRLFALGNPFGGSGPVGSEASFWTQEFDMARACRLSTAPAKGACLGGRFRGRPPLGASGHSRASLQQGLVQVRVIAGDGPFRDLYIWHSAPI